ncbi:MAG: PH domain-containing protein [Clostridia bacterium]|nr:PH domain-containing protein [Clostridia bacterium]
MKKIDEKYFINTNAGGYEKIEDIIGADEQVLWRGKPKKSAYMLSTILKMMPVALLWLAFDSFFIISMFASDALTEAPLGVVIFLIAFFAIHLAPVWIWVGNIVTSTRQYKNLEYVFTNKRIIIKSGIIGIDFQNIYYPDIISINLKVGLIDKMLKVGDVYINSASGAKVLFDINDPYFVTQKLQEIVIDIKTDIEFPNDFRPEENHGYKTTLKK